MLPVFLVEPDSSMKRRNHADVLLHAKIRGKPGLQDMKDRLKKLRENSTCCNLPGAETLMEKLSLLPDVKVFFARDADQAVGAIEEISNGPVIAVNKSSVISKEIVPSLTGKGFEVIETYGGEFKMIEGRFRHSWQLPQLWNATSFESVGVSGRLGALRRASIEK